MPELDGSTFVSVSYLLNDYIRRVVQGGLEKTADCGCCREYSNARAALSVLQDLHMHIDPDVLDLAQQNRYFHDNWPGETRA
jgi:hypothetical protein